MKARLYQYQDEFHLFLCTGKSLVLNKKEVREFLRTYAAEAYYANTEGKSGTDSVTVPDAELMAVVEDNMELRICNTEFLRDVFSVDVFPYLTSEEFAEKHNRKQAIVLRLCRDGRLEGAVQRNGSWLIPEDTPYPADARVGIRVPSARSKQTQNK